MTDRSTQQVAESKTLIDYTQWVRSALSLGVDAGTRILEKPSDDTVVAIEQARTAGEPRVICGFLPDEVEWPKEGGETLMTWFASRAEFVPWRLNAPPVVSDVRHGPVVLVRDRPVSEQMPSAFAALAASAARGCERALHVVEADRVAHEDLAHAIAHASVVFQDVSDWSLGFAVDELAARCGRVSVRARHPGYSLLRHALLGQVLLPSESPDVLRVRDQLKIVLGQGPATMASCAEDAFAPRTSGAWWGAILKSPTFQSFASGNDWQPARRAIEPGDRRWTNQIASWALLSAAGRSTQYPRVAWDVVAQTITSWLLAEQRSHRPAPVRDRALIRWVRLFPEWLETYRKTAGETPEARAVVEFWVSAALDWRGCADPVLGMFEHGRWALLQPRAASGHGPTVDGWRRDWGRIATAPASNLAVSRSWMPLCVEAAAARLHETRERASDSGAAVLTLPGLAAWEACMGAAGVFMAAWTAMWLHRPSFARQVVRTWCVREGIPVRAGYFRIVRESFSEASDFVPWLANAARYPRPESVESLLIARWSARQLANLWRRKLSDRTARDLDVILDLFEHRRAKSGAAFDPALHAALSALGGRAAAASRIVGDVASAGRSVGVLPGLVALALWCRGAEADAAAMLQDHPATAGDSAMALFLRAIALELLQRTDSVTDMLRALERVSPGFLRDHQPGDTRWLWAATLFARSGDATIARRMHERAMAAGVASPSLFEDAARTPAPISELWMHHL